MIREVERKAMSGLLVAAVLLVLFAITPFAAINADKSGELIQGLQVGGLVLLEVLLGTGFFIVQPNQAKALQLFGKYVGTVKTSGLWWANPFSRAGTRSAGSPRGASRARSARSRAGRRSR